MSTFRLTLQNRITTFLIISSIILISSFIIIQVNNQAANIQRYNTYQANLSSVIVKNNLEAAIRQVDPNEVASYLEAGLNELKDAEIIDTALVFDPQGKILAASQKGLSGENVCYKDLDRIKELENIAGQDKWLIPVIDKNKETIDIFIALRAEPQGKVTYLAKLSFSLGNIQEALIATYRPIILATIIVILAVILFGYLLSKTVVGPIKVLNESTKMIAEGDLSIRTNIRTNDELQELGKTFNHMTEELIKMKERAENANPLTKLPGNIVIYEEVEKRIQDKKKFTVIYGDLDNFKSFNDKYGIAKGDEAIELTASVFKEAISKNGNADDFLGHEGGDDFILLTNPEKAEAIAEYIIKEFAQRIRTLYSQEDLENGHITALSRDGSVKKFPIMTISLAGVSNEQRPICSYPEVTNIAADVKRKVKLTEGNAFLIDRRHS